MGIEIKIRVSMLLINGWMQYRIEVITKEEKITLRISLTKNFGLIYFLTKIKFKIKSKLIDIKYAIESPMAEK